jgi:hypothetical protein
MITLQQFFETTNYRITEGDSYGWNCFGPNSHQLSSWNGVHGTGGWSANIVFSTKTQKVYEVTVCDYTNDRAYRVINPTKLKKFREESDTRGEIGNQAWDDVDYIDLETDEDFMEKFSAIVSGAKYDTRIQVPLTLDNDQLFMLMQQAHEHDLTLNAYVEHILKRTIEAINTEQSDLFD